MAARAEGRAPSEERGLPTSQQLSAPERLLLVPSSARGGAELPSSMGAPRVEPIPGPAPVGAGKMAERPPTPQPAVVLSAVTRVFRATPALVRASLIVERGEVVLLRGPNGAGKSTLLRVVATALSPTFGRGQVLGLDLVAGRAEIRRRTELLGHRTRLYEDLTALENLAFAAAVYGFARSKVSEALDAVGLAAVADERVSGFSQGMRQRLAVARATLRQPELVLLDEPYAGLDPTAKEIVDDVVRRARAEDRTVLLASHEPPGLGLVTRTVLMADGQIRGELSPGQDPGQRRSGAG